MVGFGRESSAMSQTIHNEKPPRDAASDLRRGLVSFAWPFFAAMWLLFPLGEAIRVLRTAHSPVQAIPFLASMAVFASVFLWLMLRYPFRGSDLTPPERRVRDGLLAALVALTLHLEFVYYDGGIPYRFMFVLVAAAVTLPTLRAVWVVAACVVAAGGMYAVRSGWETLLSSWERAIAPFVIVGISVILVSRLVLTVRELQAAREEISRLAVSEERLRFARDLHDLLGRSLSSIALKSELAGKLLPSSPENAAREVRDIERLARRSLREVREAVAGYRQPTLASELEGAGEMLEAAGIELRVEDESGVLPARTEAVLAWAVREGVTNVIRHSRARHCEILLKRTDGEVHASITDDGTGYIPERVVPAGTGLSGLEERVASFADGGSVEAGPLPQGGFRLSVILPLEDDEGRTNGRGGSP